MITRIALLVLCLTTVAAADAKAQGRTQRQVVLSDSVLRAMIAQKPKTKTPFSPRVAAMLQSAAKGSTRQSVHTPPASVTEIKKTPRK